MIKMKLNTWLTLVIITLTVVIIFQAVQISRLKSDVHFFGKMADIGFESFESLNQKQIRQEQVAEYIKTHNGSAPPASWYPNGDPWRNFTAEEANEMLKDCEDSNHSTANP